jgi:hypothetical protein
VIAPAGALALAAQFTIDVVAGLLSVDNLSMSLLDPACRFRGCRLCGSPFPALPKVGDVRRKHTLTCVEEWSPTGCPRMPSVWPVTELE